MTAAGITAPQFANELRKVFSSEDSLLSDVKIHDLASAQERFQALFELSEGLPERVRHDVRIKLEKVRHRLDYPLQNIREISDEKQRNHFIGKIIGEAIWNWWEGQKLQQVAYELAAWLPAPTPTGDDDAGGRRGEATGEIPQDALWITGAEAERQTLVNRGTIKRAADAGKITTNGKSGDDKRYHVASVHAWNKTRVPDG